jgi:acyl-CoA synthetase (AMP-forming)/AMP-acid ligase II
MLVRDYLVAQARTWPDRTAYVADCIGHTWTETADRVARLAAGLKALGVGKGVLPGALRLLFEVGKSLPADWERPRTLPPH